MSGGGGGERVVPVAWRDVKDKRTTVLPVSVRKPMIGIAGGRRRPREVGTGK